MRVVILQLEGVVRGGWSGQGDVGRVEGVEGRIDGAGSPGLLSGWSDYGREELGEILPETEQPGGSEVQELHLSLPPVTTCQAGVSVGPGQFLLDQVGEFEHRGPEH